MITLSLDVYESKDYANLYRAWYRLHRFFLSKQSANFTTEYFFIVRDSSYQSEQTFFLTPKKWLSNCAHFRDFVNHVRDKGVAVASQYARLIRKICLPRIYWARYSPSLSDQELIDFVSGYYIPSDAGKPLDWSKVTLTKKQEEERHYRNMLIDSYRESHEEN